MTNITIVMTNMTIELVLYIMLAFVAGYASLIVLQDINNKKMPSFLTGPAITLFLSTFFYAMFKVLDIIINGILL